jgi:hypothetical protein
MLNTGCIDATRRSAPNATVSVDSGVRKVLEVMKYHPRRAGQKLRMVLSTRMPIVECGVLLPGYIYFLILRMIWTSVYHSDKWGEILRKVSSDRARSRYQSRCGSIAHLSSGTGCFKSILEAPNTPPPQHQTPQGTTSVMWYHICHCHDHDSVSTSHQPTAFVARPTKSLERVSRL